MRDGSQLTLASPVSFFFSPTAFLPPLFGTMLFRLAPPGITWLGSLTSSISVGIRSATVHVNALNFYSKIPAQWTKKLSINRHAL